MSDLSVVKLQGYGIYSGITEEAELLRVESGVATVIVYIDEIPLEQHYRLSTGKVTDHGDGWRLWSGWNLDLETLPPGIRSKAAKRDRKQARKGKSKRVRPKFTVYVTIHHKVGESKKEQFNTPKEARKWLRVQGLSVTNAHKEKAKNDVDELWSLFPNSH